MRTTKILTTKGLIIFNIENRRSDKNRFHPDRIEVVNPGALPLRVTPQNILHKTVKRNEHFAYLCYALQMMEHEGSGYDKMYEVLLSNGKQIPKVEEGDEISYQKLWKQLDNMIKEGILESTGKNRWTKYNLKK